MKRIVGSLVLLLIAGSLAFAQGLTVWTSYQSPTIEFLQEDAAAFSSAFGIDVEIVNIDLNELRQQVLLSAPQGEGPDVIVGLPHDQLGELAVGGVVADMSSAATATYLSDLSEQARLAFTYNGRLFGLPLFVEGPALMYNRDLVSEVPATYEELVSLAQDLTTSDTFGFLFDINNFYFSYGWFGTYGGYVFGREDGALTASDVGLDNEGAIAGAEALRALRFDTGLIPSGTNYDVANGLFIDGALAMTYNGAWGVPQARDAGIDVGIAPMPPLADGRPWTGFMGVQGVLVSEFSEDKTGAFNLAKWLVRGDAQLEYALREGRIPASVSALEQISDDPIIAGYGEALLNSEPMPNIPAMGQVWGPMGNALSVLTDDASADVAAVLQSAVGQIEGE